MFYPDLVTLPRTHFQASALWSLVSILERHNVTHNRGSRDSLVHGSLQGPFQNYLQVLNFDGSFLGNQCNSLFFMSLPPVKETKGGSRHDTKPCNGLQRKTGVHAGLLPFFVAHMEQKRVQGSPPPHLDRSFGSQNFDDFCFTLYFARSIFHVLKCFFKAIFNATKCFFV